jgi:hypothetical protein
LIKKGTTAPRYERAVFFLCPQNIINRPLPGCVFDRLYTLKYDYNTIRDIEWIPAGPLCEFSAASICFPPTFFQSGRVHYTCLAVWSYRLSFLKPLEPPPHPEGRIFDYFLYLMAIPRYSSVTMLKIDSTPK